MAKNDKLDVRKTRVVTTRLHPATYEEIKEAAYQRRMTISAVIGQLVDSYLSKINKR